MALGDGEGDGADETVFGDGVTLALSGFGVLDTIFRKISRKSLSLQALISERIILISVFPFLLRMSMLEESSGFHKLMLKENL